MVLWLYWIEEFQNECLIDVKTNIPWISNLHRNIEPLHSILLAEELKQAGCTLPKQRTGKGNVFYLSKRDCNWPCLSQRGSPRHSWPGDRIHHVLGCWDNWRNQQGQSGNLHILEHTYILTVALDDIRPLTYSGWRVGKTTQRATDGAC